MLASIRRNIIDPLRVRKSGSPIRNHWKDLEKTQYLPVDEQRRRQWDRLKEMLDSAWSNNTFWHNRFVMNGITPDDIRDPVDLTLLPPLTKKELQQAGTSAISNRYPLSQLREARTGGSTGTSLRLWHTEACSEMRNAAMRRHNRWSGWNVGEPVAAVWGNVHAPVLFKERLKDDLFNPAIYLDTMNIDPVAVLVFAEKWRRMKPTLLYGHAHSLYLLARLIPELCILDLKPRAVISTSMMLLQHERETIEEIFGAPVFDRYGCEEVGLIASECEAHMGMHINTDHVYVEFIRDDGTPAGPGEQGIVTVTDLLNRAMPLIRYRIEDVSAPLDVIVCPCGRHLPLMQRVTGRVADFLVKPDGARVAGVSLIENTLTKIPGIEQMQIIQEEDITSFTVKLVRNKEFGHAQRQDLHDYLSSVFGRISLRIEEVGSIPPEQNGKYRFSICKVAISYQLSAVSHQLQPITPSTPTSSKNFDADERR